MRATHLSYINFELPDSNAHLVCRCRILEANGIKFDPFNASPEALRKAMATADQFRKSNRALFGDLYDFDAHPPIINQEDPIASLYYYVQSHGRKRTNTQSKGETWDMKADPSKMQAALSNAESSLEILKPLAKIAKRDEQSVKMEHPDFEDLKKKADVLRIAHSPSLH